MFSGGDTTKIEGLGADTTKIEGLGADTGVVSEADEALALISAGLDKLAAVDHQLATTSERETTLGVLARLQNRAGFEFARAVRVWDAHLDWAVTHRSPRRALTSKFRVAGSGILDAARRLDVMPNVAEGWSAGEITEPAARMIAGAYSPEHGEQFEQAEPIFAAAASTSSLRDTARIVDHFRGLCDATSKTKTAEEQWEHRAFTINPVLDGMWKLDGKLDAAGAAALIAVLEAIMEQQRPASGEPERSRPQRRADALVELARLAAGQDLFGDRPKTGRRTRPNVSVVIDLETLLGGPGVRAEEIHVGPISAEAARRIACDAGISPIILGSGSVPLDLGRTTRTFSDAQYRAIIARDRHCRFSDCTLPPHWCDVHHIDAWERGGPTDIGNAILGCGRHHHLWHEGGWRAERLADNTVISHGPNGQHLASEPPDRLDHYLQQLNDLSPPPDDG